MKAFIQFYHMSTGYPSYKDEDKHPIEACGDRSVILLDGRNTLDTWKQIAEAEGVKRGYVGYAIHKGNFRNSTALVKFTSIPQEDK